MTKLVLIKRLNIWVLANIFEDIIGIDIAKKMIEMATIDQHNKLLQNIKEHLPKLKKLLGEISDHWCYEDMIYRFYHQSFKVYALQTWTLKILDALKKLVPEETKLHPFLEVILKEGASEKQFEFKHNQEWLMHTRPMVEVFLHMKFFLEMAIKYGEKLDFAPNRLPSGWAALLYLFNLR